MEQISTGDKRRPVIERGKLTTCKFGGTSLADGKAFRKVKDILSEDDRRRMIVVSAPGRRFKGDTKITDLLIAMSKEDGFTEESHELFSEIKRRFHTIEKDLGMQDVLSDEYEKIEFEIRNGATYPYIASRGEYLSAKLMADYLGWEFIAPEKYLKFDAQGIFQYEQSLELLKAALEDVERGVIPGFYGSDFSNKIVTFSRGGSDVTGALVAAACSADLYENWTDVSGLLMADPQIVPNPITVPVITYKELRELSYMGAAVMHPDAIKPVRQLCIPINIRNTNRPEDGGTLIVENADYYGIGDFITGITGTSNLMSILIEKENLNEDPHFRGEILHRLVNQGIRVNHTLSEIDSITLIIDKGQLSSIIDVKSMIEGILESYIKDVNVVVDPDLSIIAIVGRNIGTTPDVAVRVLNALSMRRINVKLIDHGPRRYNILIGVPQDNYKTSINAIYNNFIGHKL
ncbi:aspartate kinase [Eubacteriales bacterium KG125]